MSPSKAQEPLYQASGTSSPFGLSTKAWTNARLRRRLMVSGELNLVKASRCQGQTQFRAGADATRLEASAQRSLVPFHRINASSPFTTIFTAYASTFANTSLVSYKVFSSESAVKTCQRSASNSIFG